MTNEYDIDTKLRVQLINDVNPSPRCLELRFSLAGRKYNAARDATGLRAEHR